MTHEELEKSRIALDILTYLLDHPQAQDTLEGILDWWLLERFIRSQRKLVKDAVQELVRQGFVEAVSSPDSPPRYHLNLKKLEEIRSRLRSLEE